MSSRQIRNYFLSILVISIGIILSIIAFVNVLKWEDHKISAGFNNSAEIYYTNLREEVKSDVQVLSSVQAFFDLHEGQSREEFRSFDKHILTQHKVFHAIAWLPRVPDSSRKYLREGEDRTGFQVFKSPKGKARE